MANNPTGNKNDNNAENDTVTGVEVVKDDTVVYEDGDFDDYNANHDLESEAQDQSDSGTQARNNNASDSSDQSGKSSRSSDTRSDSGSDNADTDKDKGRKDSSNKDESHEQSDSDQTSSDSDKDQESDQNENADKKDSDKSDDSNSSDKNSDKDKKSDKKEGANQDDKSGLTMANLYQWVTKLKDELTTEASDLTHGVTEKAAAAILTKLKDGVDMELAAFDKSVETAKNLVENADERRKKIESKKDKYQDMIDKLDQS